MIRSSRGNPPSGWRWLLLALAGAVGLAGYLGPWVPHPAAGLIIMGLDLGEYVKFLPQVMSREVPLSRELFYLPLFTSSLSASLLASRFWHRRGGALSLRWPRLLLALAAIPIALAMLPPAWSPATLTAVEFRWQVLAIGVCLLFAVLSPVLRYLPDRLVLAVIGLLALAAAIVPAWDFLRVQPLIARLYGHPLRLGWGFGAHLAGYLGLALVSVAEIIRQRD